MTLNLPGVTDNTQEEENDDEVTNSFLGVNRNFVRSAREPKVPKDYIDSSTDAQSSQSERSTQKPKPKIKQVASVSLTAKELGNVLGQLDVTAQAPKTDQNSNSNSNSNSSKSTQTATTATATTTSQTQTQPKSKSPTNTASK